MKTHCDRAKLEKLILRHEGYKRFPYVDTRGFLTIGVGRNLAHKGLSHDEIMYLLRNDLNEAEEQLAKHDWAKGHGCIRWAVLVDMAFNLGIGGMLRFRKMIAALEAKDYQRAAAEMLNSRWAEQVGRRAKELARMMETGEWSL